MSRWYLGSMNDGLFIIDRKPSGSGTDVPPGVYASDPEMVLTVVALSEEQAQAIVDAHNEATSPSAPDSGVTERIAEAIDREERLIRGGMLPNMAADQHMKSWGEGARFVLGLVLHDSPAPVSSTGDEGLYPENDSRPIENGTYIPPDERFDSRYRAGHAAGWDAALRAAAEPRQSLDGLAEAWEEAEAALPDGVGLALHALALSGWAEAVAGDISEQAPTPAAALRSLAAKLREGTT